MIITGRRILSLERIKRLDGYLVAISRDDINPATLVLEDHNYRVCSRHFVSGKPAGLYNITSPDCLPTLHMGHSKKSKNNQVVSANVERYERAAERDRKRILLEKIEDELPGITFELIDETISEELESIASQEIEMGMQYIKAQTSHRESNGNDCQWGYAEELQKELVHCKATVDKLTQQLDDRRAPFSEKSFVSDEYTKFYTRLLNFRLVKAVFDHVSKGLPPEGATKLSYFQEFMRLLIKLRTKVQNEDLAYRFNISPATISRIILKWLKRMDMCLSGLIFWPDREALRKTMPECFKASFESKVAVIIDCFEVFIERPSNLLARAATWSNYKHHNTSKVLLGITPQGVVSFVSDCWGGRVSDKYLTEHSGLRQKLLPGDIVLADRGFDIEESVGVMQTKLHIPAFTKGKTQLTAVEVEETRSIANVWIHVERVIGCVRQKYPILQSTIPITFCSTRKGEDTPSIDHIVRICCALTSMCNSVVPFE